MLPELEGLIAPIAVKNKKMEKMENIKPLKPADPTSGIITSTPATNSVEMTGPTSDNMSPIQSPQLKQQVHEQDELFPGELDMTFLDKILGIESNPNSPSSLYLDVEQVGFPADGNHRIVKDDTINMLCPNAMSTKARIEKLCGTSGRFISLGNQIFISTSTQEMLPQKQKWRKHRFTKCELKFCTNMLTTNDHTGYIAIVHPDTHPSGAFPNIGGYGRNGAQVCVHHARVSLDVSYLSIANNLSKSILKKSMHKVLLLTCFLIIFLITGPWCEEKFSRFLHRLWY